MANPLNGFLSVLASTCRLVVCVIPPLLRLGLIDRPLGVVLGAVIGIVVASWSIGSSTRQDPPVGQDLGSTFGSLGARPWR